MKMYIFSACVTRSRISLKEHCGFAMLAARDGAQECRAFEETISCRDNICKSIKWSEQFIDES